MKTTHLLKTLEDLEKVALRLAGELQAGDRVGLIGGLGAGKTTLVQQLARRLGVLEPVDSPTFIVRQAFSVHQHPTIRRLVHIDLYRLGAQGDGQDRFDELGLRDDWEDAAALILVEWIDLWPALRAQTTDEITIDWQPGTNLRRFTQTKKYAMTSKKGSTR